MKNYNTEFDEIVIKIANQNGGPLEIEDKVNLALLINKQEWHALRALQPDDILYGQEKEFMLKLWIFLICKEFIKQI